MKQIFLLTIAIVPKTVIFFELEVAQYVAANAQYFNDAHTFLKNFGPKAFFSEEKLTSSSIKQRKINQNPNLAILTSA